MLQRIIRQPTYPEFTSRKLTPAPRGQSLVEFAIVLPILVLLIIGAVDLGRMYFAYMTIKNMSREGAFYATIYPPVDDAFGMTAAQAIANTRARAKQEASVAIANDPSLLISPTCPSDAACPAESTVRVTVSYDFTMVTTKIFLSSPIKLSAYTEMLIVGH